MRTLLLLSALLLPASLAGCSGLPGEAPEGCGEERRHHVDQQATPVDHAIVRTEGTDLVYLWEIKVTGACKAEHVAIDMEVIINRQYEQPDVDGDQCAPVTSIIGAAYLPGSFVSARTITLAYSGSADDSANYVGSTSYGLKQAAGAEDAPAAYTTDVEVHYPIGDDEEGARDCASVMVEKVEIEAVDRVDK